jgi:hypothetical protein
MARKPATRAEFTHSTWSTKTALNAPIAECQAESSTALTAMPQRAPSLKNRIG